MITGFNTDVRHEGQIYHVQTEDRGRDEPVLESLVYIKGAIVAKKLTPYSDQLSEGATEEKIASLLKRQHHVIIAAIKAGRIGDLVRHTRREQGGNEPRKARSTGKLAAARARTSPDPAKPVGSGPPTSPVFQPVVAPRPHRASPRSSGALKVKARTNSSRGDTVALDLDQVIADYLERSSDQAKLDIRVITPEVFTAGKSVGLRVQVTHDSKPEFDAIVTLKIIGTAFKPQVFIGRVGGDGIANFSLTLPAFTAGTAAIVIEAQSGTGRGELKNLIRRA